MTRSPSARASGLALVRRSGSPVGVSVSAPSVSVAPCLLLLVLVLVSRAWGGVNSVNNSAEWWPQDRRAGRGQRVGRAALRHRSASGVARVLLAIRVALVTRAALPDVTLHVVVLVVHLGLPVIVTVDAAEAQEVPRHLVALRTGEAAVVTADDGEPGVVRTWRRSTSPSSDSSGTSSGTPRSRDSGPSCCRNRPGDTRCTRSACRRRRRRRGTRCNSSKHAPRSTAMSRDRTSRRSTSTSNGNPGTSSGSRGPSGPGRSSRRNRPGGTRHMWKASP